MRDCEYWIWLSRAFGEGAKIDDAVNYFGSARQLYEAGSYEWKVSGLLTPRQIDNLSRYSPSQSEKIINQCRENGWLIITPDDGEYPPLLREICNFPAVLYADGDAELLKSCLPIAMVGTRRASDYGLRAASALSGMLAKCGMTVVSGGALGVDSASHTGCMHAGGRTIAVLGCGLGTDYLRENEALRREIAKNGALVTEYAPFTPATKYTFPKRNRIISGMSLGTVVIEAGERSGSLITARLAVEQNRDVFAVPGDVFSSSFSGANKLIRDGAKPVFTARDVVEEYYNEYPDRIKTENSDESLADIFFEAGAGNAEKPPEKKAVKKNAAESEKKAVIEPKALPDGVSEAARAVHGAIDGETDFDDIVRKTGLGIPKVLAGITELEVLSCIEALPGRKYKKI